MRALQCNVLKKTIVILDIRKCIPTNDTCICTTFTVEDLNNMII